MHFCTKQFKNFLFGLLLALSLAPVAHAEGIAISKVEVRLDEQGYLLSGSYDVELNAPIRLALSRGIPLYFVGEFSISRPRWGWVDELQQTVSSGIASLWGDEPTQTHWAWLDEDVYAGEHTITFSYNILTRQYRISRGSLFQNFASYEDAINLLSRQNSEVISQDLLDTDEEYVASARLHLDVSQLPSLLQVNALTDNNWTLDSDWYHWEIKPAKMVIGAEGQVE